MATINQNIAAVRTAIFGKDVREAIADSLEQMKEHTEDFMERVDTLAKVTDDNTGIVIRPFQNP